MIDEIENNKYDENFYPCKYAEYYKDQNEWKVGVKFKNTNEEYVFSTKDYKGNLDVVSVEFAIMVLEVYKLGGKKAVKSWLAKAQ
jgi:hypothetical protein